MSPAYQIGRDDDPSPHLAIRRHTDRCFFAVEQVTDEGYIVERVMIGRDEVAEMIELDDQGQPVRQCNHEAPNETQSSRGVGCHG